MCGILPEFLVSNHFRVCLFNIHGWVSMFNLHGIPCQQCPQGGEFVKFVSRRWAMPETMGSPVSLFRKIMIVIDHHSKEMKHACAMVASIGESLAYPCIYNLHSCSLTNAPGRFDLFPFCALKMHEAPAKIHDIFRHAPSL